jgi:Exostosin family
MLKLFTDKTFLKQAFRRDVFPLLFDLVFLENESIKSKYQLVDSANDCDIIVFPIDYTQFLKHKSSLNNLQKISKKYNKPIWIYTAGDYGFTNYIQNSYTFRLGGFKSKLSDDTFIMPSFVNDPYLNSISQEFSVLKKENQPTIGFVGHAQSGLKKYVSELMNHLKYRFKKSCGLMVADSQVFYPSSVKRANYLAALQRSKLLKTNFILRNNYRGGVQNELEKQESTKDFYNNIFNNAYTFCMRGVGNFSVRFYETLAVGRIPILMDTDCKLPLDNLIDWNKHCVILDEKSKASFEEQILNFHNSKSEMAFETIQKENRLLWETHLILHKYFIKIHDIFSEKIN